MSLSSLNSSLNHWSNQVRSLNALIKKLKRRRSDLEEVLRNLKNTVTDNSSDVNNRIKSSASKIDSAIDYSGKNNILNAILAEKYERAIGTDNNLTSADGELKRELSSIDRQISDSESDLSTAKRRVSDIRADIEAEERRQREESARKAAEERRQREDSAKKDAEANKGSGRF